MNGKRKASALLFLCEPVLVLVAAVFVAGLMTMPARAGGQQDADPGHGNGTMGNGTAPETQGLARLDAAALAEIRKREHERAAAARVRRLADPALALPDGGNLRIKRVDTDEFGVTHTVLQVTVDGVPLYGVMWNEHNGPRDEVEEPTILKSWSPPEVGRSTAKIGEDEAIRRAHAALGDPQSSEPPRARLYYYPLEPGKPWRLVYLIRTVVTDESSAHEWRQVVSAESGQVLNTADAGVDHAAPSTSSADPVDTNIEGCSCRSVMVKPISYGRICTSREMQRYLCVKCFTNGGGGESIKCAPPVDEGGEAIAYSNCWSECVSDASRGRCAERL